ncbi:dioxygenase [Streptomyces davaonensis JCM 4913]|uniref:Dioxygenase n=1 Tax=Streptomyces davaonensis (strain DSM 101723 / JCM 4913 / KCC S-0913 / 768) TaxID=1214101 RepID=K4R4U3_STRDJ|nr:carbohydrate-binding protein [Streptomyces davaonensis]CCK28105.1 dioxygenase [Streptomyces davaonensis JCM 4913]
MDSETNPPHSPLVSRKTVLRAALAAGAAVPLAMAGGPALARTFADTGTPVQVTPPCDDGDDPTPDQIEGPYFKPNSPQRTDIAGPGVPGTRLMVTGYVFGLACRPIAGALLDFWQADHNGAYDNTGYRFRGHQFTASNGSFALTTIVPGLYPGRTRHIHVKVQAPGRPVLTTQLYFPNEPRNSTDSLFDPRLLMAVRDGGGGRQASFDFVLNVPQDPDDPGDPGDTTWSVGTTYQSGARVTYAGRGYLCLQAHTAQTGWEPPNVPALWQAA